MPNKLFLETYPLYRKFEVNIEPVRRGMYGYTGTTLEKVPRPSINMHCALCVSTQTFNMINNYWDDDNLNQASVSPAEHTFRLKYLCAGCNKKLILLYIEFGQTTKEVKRVEKVTYWIRKVGQNPPWEIDIEKNLESLLGGPLSNLYKNGLVCESQSYGIGAYAYYRRIVEEIIDSLLDSITELIDKEEDKEKYLEVLEETKKEKSAESKIKLVKDLLPTSLKPENINPLGIIHSALSEGLHDKSDEECLELADEIRKSLIFLINQTLSQKEAKKEFSASMRKLLGKKHGKS